MLLVMIFTKMLSPTLAVSAIIGGLLIRRPWQVLVVAIVSASILECLLLFTHDGYHFDLLLFLTGIWAGGLWAWLTFFLKLRWRKKTTDT